MIPRPSASRSTETSRLSLSDTIDTRTASGRLVLHVLGAVSQWEREATAERTRDALAQLRADGVRLGADAFGWRRSDALDVYGHRRCEEVVPVTVRRMLELQRQGLSVRAIATALETEGHGTKRAVVDGTRRRSTGSFSGIGSAAR